jgi:long-chain acyl-CoA synthetase
VIVSLEKLTLAELCRQSSAKFRKRVAFEIYSNDYTYCRFTYSEFGDLARQFAGLLSSLGVGQGDRVMLLSENRPEWVIAYFGIALSGAISVPVLVDFSEEQIAAIASHADVSAICVTEKTAAKTLGPDAAIPRVYIDSIENTVSAASGSANMNTAGIAAASIVVLIQSIAKRLPMREKSGLPEAGEDDIASVIYTSGTLGNSKGVMLSHKNLVWTSRSSRSFMKIYPRDRLLSVIPLAHTYECTIGMLSAVMSGASTVYLDKPPSPSALLPAIQALRPTAMVTVPLFIEKIYRNKIAPRLFNNPFYKFPLTRYLAVRLAGRSLMSFFGSAIRFLGTGGAPLAEDVEVFLHKTGFPYSPGYGLTETSPLVAGTAPYRFPFRSVGKILNGVEARIADKDGDGIGEIQVRGPNVMKGYYRDEARTRDAFTQDGFFKTGDLGYVDKKGYLFIKGRLKAMLLGPSGENIYPEEIENLLHTSLLVEDAIVRSGSKGEVVALITLSEKAQTAWAALGDNVEELRNAVNKRLASFSRINRIEVQDKPFEKTPTAKIKRFLYQDQIEENKGEDV